MIIGTTREKRGVFDTPRGSLIGSIKANVDIIATENKFQWLHLASGGWVNAGDSQQYITWKTVPDSTVIVPPYSDQIKKVKNAGKIATLLVDYQNPKWKKLPRSLLPDWTGLACPPQTVVFNTAPRVGKGARIPYPIAMHNYVFQLNSEKIADAIERPETGWINKVTNPPSIERLTWAANHVIVTETRAAFSKVYAPSHHDLMSGSFFDKDMRLVVHKFNAVTPENGMIKLGKGHNCYTPFFSDSDMWIPTSYLEMWPALPFTLDSGRKIVEYELIGHHYFGKYHDGKSVLLYDPQGFKTNWRINSPDVPI